MSLSPGLDREAADRALVRLDEENDRIAEALVAMDAHPGHQLLRAAPLTGRTALRWTETSTAMATLWEQFEAYRTLLERAREVRARRGRPGQAELDELSELLTGSVVELNAAQLPIERRSLTGPAQTVDRITLDDLVSRMKAGYAAVTVVLAEVDAAASAALRRIDPLDGELRAALALAGSVGADPAGLEALRDRLIDARELVSADPLGFAAGDPLAGLETELAAAAGRLAELGAARDSFDERIARLSAALADVASVQERTRAVHAEVLEKIANPGLPPVAGLTGPLGDRLAGIGTLRPDWARVAAALEQLDRAVAAALTEATTALEANTGLLDRRAELRGRLDAYRAKAARLGRAEDLELAARYTAAHDLLYTRPTDLAAATRAVNHYQQAVAEESR